MKVTIIIPTYNEQDNIGQLIKEIKKVGDYDILVVDDGKDATQAIALMEGAEVLQGQHKGLGQAIIDGINYAQTPIVLVMDADLSHPVSAIPRMIAPLMNGYDMTIGSRYVKGGRTEGWELSRRIISRMACLLALPITTIRDSTSGFFAIRKEIIDGVKLKGSSWKIMLEILVKAKPIRVKEIPFTFKVRQEGKSKFNRKQVIAYLKHLALLAISKYKGIMKFGIVGGIGAILHFGLLFTLTDIVGINYLVSAVICAVTTTTFNYTLNHFWTFERRKIKGNWFIGWLKYELIDDASDAIYIGQLALFVEVFGMWYMAGAVLATIINYPIRYLIFKRFVWESQNKKKPTNKDYEWLSYYQGDLVQKWWKHSIAKTVWKWIPNNSSLLDVGCGSSPIITNYNNAIGIDTNQEKLNFMSNKFPSLAFINSQTSAFASNSFDYVLCIEVLEHLENPALMVKEISRILKPGGRAVIATPDYNKFLWRIAETFTPYKDDHHNNFTMDKLDRLCEKYDLMPTIYKYVATCDLIEMFVKCDTK